MIKSIVHRFGRFAFLTLACLAGAVDARAVDVPLWGRFEQSFESSRDYTNPVQQAEFKVTFTAPKGSNYTVYGFWDGNATWRVRFIADQAGEWSYVTSCSDAANTGLNKREGKFTCVKNEGKTRFAQHGPIHVSTNGYSFEHADGSPFFFLSDTAWNGALLSTEADWDFYLKERTRQQFSAVQWVCTQWRAAPDGDIEKRKAYEGKESISINPEFFKRLDKKADAVNQAGMLNVPVLLWAINHGSNPAINPGQSLPESQAILLARYMVARWQGNAVMWILPGDGHYFGSEGEKWKRIGRAVFGDIPHAPVSLHPQGRHWNFYDFQNESWLDVMGYQSGHGDKESDIEWLVRGPIVKDWHVVLVPDANKNFKRIAPRPIINLEPPYEGHLGYSTKQPITADFTRRAIYWSLLCAPTAGSSYGAHGVWGWDDGTKPPTDHPGTGTPMPWRKALLMPGAEQMTNLYSFFTSLPFDRLRPAPDAVVNNPGMQDVRKYVAAARSIDKEVTVVYVPEDRTVEILISALPTSPEIRWWNPRTGEKNPAVAVVTDKSCQFPTPAPGDWLLVMRQKKEGEKSK